MKKALTPYSEAFNRLQARIHDLDPTGHDLSPGEFAMLISNQYLLAYPKSNLRYNRREQVSDSDFIGVVFPFPPPEPYQSLQEFIESDEGDAYADQYRIRLFNFNDTDVSSIEDLEDCFFNPEEIDAFTFRDARDRYLTFQQLTERWKDKKLDIGAYIKRKATSGDTSNPFTFSLYPFYPIYLIDSPVEERLFSLYQIEDAERKWFPASPGGDRAGTVPDNHKDLNIEPARGKIRPRKQQVRERNPGAFQHRAMNAFEDAEKRTPTPEELWEKIKAGGVTADVTKITENTVFLCDAKTITLPSLRRWYKRSAFEDNKDINDQ